MATKIFLIPSPRAALITFAGQATADFFGLATFDDVLNGFDVEQKLADCLHGANGFRC